MSQRLSTPPARPGPSVPLIAVGGAICVVMVSSVYAVSTRWRSEGELVAAYAEVDHQAAHADMAEARVEVAERAVELERAYYLEREVLLPHEQALIKIRDQVEAQLEEGNRILARAEANLTKRRDAIRRALRRAKREARNRQNLAAIKLVNDALALDPKRADALQIRALLYLREGDADAAIADCDAAIALQADLVDAFVTRGSAKRAKGDTAGAIADYGLAIKLDPTDIEALNNRGFVYAKRGQDAEAIRDYSRALRRDPTSVETYVNRAQARTRLGDKTGAAADLKQALRLLQGLSVRKPQLELTIEGRLRTLARS